MILQLNPPLPLKTSKGDGLAHFVIDYGPEGTLLWVVFLDDDGACWVVPNPEVRMHWNWTTGRRKPEDRAKAGKEAGESARPPQPFRPTLARPSEG
jgi:hypothetical protein